MRTSGVPTATLKPTGTVARGRVHSMAKTKKAARRTPAAARKTIKARKTPARKASSKKPYSEAPQTLHTVTPYLSVQDAASAIAWYKKAFGAKETYRAPGPGGSIMHASLKLGDSEIYLSDIFPGSEMKRPSEAGPSVTLHVWSRHVDKLWKGAVDNGATVIMPLDDQFWGDRYGRLRDPFGHVWSVSWKSKLSAAALQRKQEEAMKAFAATAAPPL